MAKLILRRILVPPKPIGRNHMPVSISRPFGHLAPGSLFTLFYMRGKVYIKNHDEGAFEYEGFKRGGCKGRAFR